MVTYEEFEELLFSLADEVPQKYYVELNGGIMAREEVKMHPQSLRNDLYVMGEYHRDKVLGRFVVLYYGSFMRLYSTLEPEELSVYMRKTLLHELQHHLESLAGEKDLEIEDAIYIAKYKHKIEEIKKRREEE